MGGSGTPGREERSRKLVEGGREGRGEKRNVATLSHYTKEVILALVVVV